MTQESLGTCALAPLRLAPGKAERRCLGPLHISTTTSAALCSAAATTAGWLCMVRPQSLMSKQIPFCRVRGHAFMEFLKGPRDYCQAQHNFYEGR